MDWWYEKEISKLESNYGSFKGRMKSTRIAHFPIKAQPQHIITIYVC